MYIVNKFDTIIQLIECLINEENEPGYCNRGGGEQGCLNLGSLSVTGQDLDAQERDRKEAEKREKRKNASEKAKKTKEIKKAQEQTNYQSQMNLFTGQTQQEMDQEAKNENYKDTSLFSLIEGEVISLLKHKAQKVLDNNAKEVNNMARNGELEGLKILNNGKVLGNANTVKKMTTMQDQSKRAKEVIDNETKREEEANSKER